MSQPDPFGFPHRKSVLHHPVNFVCHVHRFKSENKQLSVSALVQSVKEHGLCVCVSTVRTKIDKKHAHAT